MYTKPYLSEKVLLLLLAVIFWAGMAQAQTKPVEALKPILIVDPRTMTEDERAQVLPNLAQLLDVNDWETITVEPDDNLYLIINRKYRWYDRLYRKTAKALAELIRIVNNLPAIEKLRSGQKLRVPRLPQRPLRDGADADSTQVLEMRANLLYRTGLEELSLEKENRPTPTVNLRAAATWTIFAPAEKLGLFLGRTPKAILKTTIGRTIYIGATTETAVLNLAVAGTCSSPVLSFRESQETTSTLANLVPSPDAKYYLLDFYSGIDSRECPHGKLVLEAARLALEGYGARAFEVSLVPVEVDFYANKDAARAVMNRYVKGFTEDVRKNLEEIVKRLMGWERDRNYPLAQPLFYLQALYADLSARSDVAVVSASFWTRFDGFVWLPPDYSTDSEVVLLNAVLNEEDYLQVEDSSASRIEPIRSFWDRRKDYGVALVGAERSPGVAVGMRSRDGDGVAFLDRGYSLGPPESCLGKRGGASFATPRIGTLFLLARVFWKANGMRITATEAKVRMLLASEVVPAYIGQYASAGIPRLERVLRKDGAFAVDLSGKMHDVTIKGESFLEVTPPNGAAPDQLRFRRGSIGFSGMQVAGGQLYIFREAALKWEKATLATIHLVVVEGGMETTLDSIDQFTLKFKEVAIL